MLAIPPQRTVSIDFRTILKPFLTGLRERETQAPSLSLIALGITKDNSSDDNIDRDITLLNELRDAAINAVEANEISGTIILRLIFHYKQFLLRIHTYELTSEISIPFTWNDAFASR